VWSSPWSAPAWMKTNNSMLHGGSLRPADEPVYAQYLGEYVRAYAAAGVPISAISVQNEPSQATSYPSMVMTSGQMAHFVGHFLGPLLQRVSPHTAIRINEEPSRDRWRYSLPVLADPLARPYIAGTDLHGYHGQSSDFTHLHQIAPRLDIWQTEVIHLDHPHYEYSDAITWASSIASDMQNWTAGWDFWNMVTDQTGLSSWGWRQDAVVIVDTHAHSVLYTPKYFALAHFSRFIRPGAHRIAADGVPPGLVACASRNPDGRIVLVVVNTRGIRSNFAISFKGGRFTTTIPGLGIATFVWR